jgi:polyhydroxyalkanoate synthesis repressor PhaR
LKCSFRFFWPASTGESNLKKRVAGMRFDCVRAMLRSIFLPQCQNLSLAPHKVLGIVTILRISLPTGNVTCRLRGGAATLSGRTLMAAKNEPVVIKKYANRRLYNTGTSTYVTLEDLAGMVKRGEDFTVQDAKSGDDITHPVLTQIIFELENKDGQTMLPIPFLRQLIAFYGDQMQMVVPSFLEQSMQAFAREQERFREQMKNALGKTPMDMMKVATPIKALEEQTRRNIEIFQNAMKMFTAFPAGIPATAAAEPATKAPAGKSDDLLELKEQIAAMQRKIDQLS